MSKRKSIIIACVLLLTVLTVVILKGEAGAKLKEAVAYSLQEDFKIKESLGQIFLVEKDKESVSVSGTTTVTSLEKPVDAIFTVDRSLGEPVYEFECEKYVGIKATEDGAIESADGNRVTLRHNDGKLSVYYNAVSYYRVGDKVKKGESIGYANGNLNYKLYENCIALDPGEYFC
jgi:hypothetical protein